MFASHQIKGMYLIKSFVSDLTFVLFFLLKLEKLKKESNNISHLWQKYSGEILHVNANLVRL